MSSLPSAKDSACSAVKFRDQTRKPQSLSQRSQSKESESQIWVISWTVFARACITSPYEIAQDRHRWRERDLSSRRLHQTEMGQRQDPIRLAFGQVPDRRVSRTRSGVSAASRTRPPHPAERTEPSRQHLWDEEAGRRLGPERQRSGLA